MEEKLLYCENCGKFTDAKIQKKRETLKVKGLDITIDVDTCVCGCCGEAVFSPDVDEASLKQFYHEYRARMSLLQPEEIRAIRSAYGMSQETFARVLGMGAKTIARYENGSIQDEAQNNLIVLMRDRNNMRRLVELHPERLSESDRFAILNQTDYSESVSSADVNANIVDIVRYKRQKGDETRYANEIYESGNDMLSISNQYRLQG